MAKLLGQVTCIAELYLEGIAGEHACALGGSVAPFDVEYWQKNASDERLLLTQTIVPSRPSH